MSTFENLLERPLPAKGEGQPFTSEGVEPHIAVGQLQVERQKYLNFLIDSSNQQKLDKPGKFDTDIKESFTKYLRPRSFVPDLVTARREIVVVGGTWTPAEKDAFDRDPLKKLGTYSVEKVSQQPGLLTGRTIKHGVRIDFIVLEGGSVVVNRKALGNQFFVESFGQNATNFESSSIGDSPFVEHGIPEGATTPVATFSFREVLLGYGTGVDYAAFNKFDPEQIAQLKLNFDLGIDIPKGDPLYGGLKYPQDMPGGMHQSFETSFNDKGGKIIKHLSIDFSEKILKRPRLTYTNFPLTDFRYRTPGRSFPYLEYTDYEEIPLRNKSKDLNPE